MSLSRQQREEAAQRRSFVADLLLVDALIQLEGPTLERVQQQAGLERLLDISYRRRDEREFRQFLGRVYGDDWPTMNRKHLLALAKRWKAGEFRGLSDRQVRRKLAEVTIKRRGRPTN